MQRGADEKNLNGVIAKMYQRRKNIINCNLRRQQQRIT
jgi:hypothetical protein